MEKQYEQFISTTYKFVCDLDRYHSTSGTVEFKDNFKCLNMNKVILKLYNITKNNINDVKNKNDKLFEKSFMVFPGIDLQYYWTVLTDNQKKKVWIYLNILYTMSDMILYMKNDCTTDTVNKFANGETESIVKFDPYVGVGTDNVEYNVDDILAGDYDKHIEQPEQVGVGSMMSMFGLDKMFNTDEIRDKLKNMTPEDIAAATDNINDMIENNDPHTTKLISSVLQNINETLNDSSFVLSSNPMDDISKIAETVTNKLKPEVEKGNVDLSKLMKQIQTFSSKSNIFPKGMNPFSMLTNMFGKNPENMSEEDHEKYINDVCNKMGLKPEDLQNMTPATIQKMVAKFYKK